MLAALVLSAVAAPPETAPRDAASRSPVVVELFTSEGCSSCPPADRLASRLVDLQRDDLIVLSYHVDYWDRLGWTDRFASPEFTARQRAYAQTLGDDRVYTPQAVVGGREDAVGSDAKTLTRLLKDQLSAARPATLDLTATRTTDAITVQLPAMIATDDAATLLVTLVQTRAETDVKRGENAGQNLSHANVVRRLETQSLPASGQVDTQAVTLPIPARDREATFAVVAYVQRNDGSIGAAGVTKPL